MESYNLTNSFMGANPTTNVNSGNFGRVASKVRTHFGREGSTAAASSGSFPQPAGALQGAGPQGPALFDFRRTAARYLAASGSSSDQTSSFASS